jgi:hypothetical protein
MGGRTVVKRLMTAERRASDTFELFGLCSNPIPRKSVSTYVSNWELTLTVPSHDPLSRPFSSGRRVMQETTLVWPFSACR